jgi:hypothetical protein
LTGFPTLKRMSAQITFDENTLAVKARGNDLMLRMDSSGSHPRIVHSPVRSRERLCFAARTKVVLQIAMSTITVV